MKFFLQILIFILSFQSSVKSNDIRDFQIEGISVGDSALDFFSEKELKESPDIFDYKNKIYRYYFLYYSKSQTYDALQITVKPNDKKFIIHAIDGHISFKKNIDDCYKSKKEVKKELDIFFGFEANDDAGNHPSDNTGDSKYSRSSYTLDDGGFVEIICYDMSKEFEKNGFEDRFAITLKTKEFLKFLTNEAYD